MSKGAEYVTGFPVHLAIDCGVSRHVAAVWFQVIPAAYLPALALPGHAEVVRTPGGWIRPPAVPLAPQYGPRSVVTVFGDFHAGGTVFRGGGAGDPGPRVHAAGLRRPRRPGAAGPGVVGADGDRADGVRGVRAGLRPGTLGRWPSHRVHDGLDQLEVLLDQGCLLLHPRCTGLKAAFQNYARRRTPGGDWLDEPADPQHPHEDLMDALRGGVRDRFPEGRIEQPRLRTVPAGTV